MRAKTRRAVVVTIVSAVVLVGAGVAFAGTITTPTGSTFTVPGDASGNPLAFTIVANGFTAGQQVFVEQCDGVLPTAAGWDVNFDCDPGQTTAAAIANGSGVATFSASDPNHAFAPFKGEGPSSLFNCLSPNQALIGPSNGLQDYRNCRIRVSSNNTVATSDQAFLQIQLPDTPVVTTSTGATTTSTTIPQNGTSGGSCSGAQLLAKAVGTDPANVGLTDQTHRVTLSAALMSDLSTKPTTKIAGTCTGLVVPADNAGGAIPATLHPKSISLKLSGIGSCASTTAARSADATKTGAFALSGLLTITMNEFDSLGKPFKTQAYVTAKGFDPASTDVLELTGIIKKGASLGATVNGKLYLDAVTKISPALKPPSGNGYTFDATTAGHCTDATAGNASIALAQMGDGTSLLGASGVSGLSFSYTAATGPASASCSGAQLLAKPVGTDPANLGLTDQSHRVVISSALMSDLSTKPTTKIAGTCTGLVVPADNAGGAIPATLHPKSMSLKLAGIGSCASSTAARAADATKANAFTLSGQLTITMNELDSLGKPFKTQAYVTGRFDPAAPDELLIAGAVIKGGSVGATVTGKLYFDPVTKISPALKPPSGNGYTFDSATSGHCTDGTADNASIATAQMGNGTSLLGTTGASGLSFGYTPAS